MSVGPGNHFDTHVDEIGAVDAPDPNTRGAVFNPTRSLEHHSKEVWPEMIRKGTKIPGGFVGVGPDLADVTRSRTPCDAKTPGPPKTGMPPVLGSVNLVGQLADKEVRIQHRREKDTAMVDAAVMERAVARGSAAASADDLRRKAISRMTRSTATPRIRLRSLVRSPAISLTLRVKGGRLPKSSSRPTTTT